MLVYISAFQVSSEGKRVKKTAFMQIAVRNEFRDDAPRGFI